MRIAFADFSGLDYQAQSVDFIPLGGSESAACHLTRCLAQAGHDVFLITSGSSPGRYENVTCLSWAQTDAAMLRSLRLDALVCVLAAGHGATLRQVLGPETPLVLWNQHAPDQAGVQALQDPRERAAYDGFAMVSDWQSEQFHQRFGIERSRMTVLRNAIAPAFTHLFADHEAILGQKAQPPVLAYTSTPFRGLALLLDAFGRIRQEIPGVRLRVYSSMRVYQASAAEDEADYGALYRRCRQMEGVEYIGSVPQPELARELRTASVLAYPNTFAETSCIAVMEAMAAGCCVVTSRLGALPETGAGFARLISVERGWDAYLAEFVATTVEVFRAFARENVMEAELRRQVAEVNRTANWPLRARQWMEWLEILAGRWKPRVIPVVSAPLPARLGPPESAPGGWNAGVASAARQEINFPSEKNRIQIVNMQQTFAMALQHHRSGRLAEAEAIYRQILAVEPRHANALHFLGVIAHQTGQNESAVDLIRQAIAMGPELAAFHSNLAVALFELRRFDEAIAACRRAIQLEPDAPAAHSNLGNALTARGQLDEAVSACRRALELKPDYPEAYYNLGNARLSQRRFDEAIGAYRRALELQPDIADAHNNLSTALKDIGQIDEAIACNRRALALRPNDSGIHSNLIYALHFHPGQDAVSIGEEQRRWNGQFAVPLRPFRLPQLNDRDPERRLRIGYVSADFRDHVVGRNVLPVLEWHERKGFEVFCYGSVSWPDELTGRCERAADVWRNIVGMGDAQVAELIRADRIDVLIDLSLHLAHHHLLVFARRPAPVQVTWAGYPGSTGLETIEYRLSDPFLDPPGMDESVYSEQTVRLPSSFWCYDPLDCRDLPVSALPARTHGFITFGCLNNFCKINDGVLRLWARVLAAVPSSRLLLLAPEGGHRQHTLDLFGQEGVASERVEFVSQQPRRKYLELYHRIDLCLDTLPYNGHTTSLESLWMGVPVVTLVGQTIAGRAGLSQLTNLGLPEWAASTPEQFVRIAAGLACDLPRLAHFRAALRERMEASPLMDAPRFARDIEAACRDMWRQWCEKSG